MWEKEKLLVTSNFSFSHSVFKRLVSQGRQKVSLCGNGLKKLIVAPHKRRYYILNRFLKSPMEATILFAGFRPCFTLFLLPFNYSRTRTRICQPMNCTKVDTRSRDSNSGPCDCEADAVPHDHGLHLKYLLAYYVITTVRLVGCDVFSPVSVLLQLYGGDQCSYTYFLEFTAFGSGESSFQMTGCCPT